MAIVSSSTRASGSSVRLTLTVGMVQALSPDPRGPLADLGLAPEADAADRPR